MLRVLVSYLGHQLLTGESNKDLLKIGWTSLVIIGCKLGEQLSLRETGLLRMTVIRY